MSHLNVDCRDRTMEFFSTIQQIQKTQNAFLANGVSSLGDGTSHRPIPKSSYAAALSSSSAPGNYQNEFDDRPDESSLRPVAPKQQSQFAQAAQHIARSIGMVTEKLEKLGKLARQRSLFNDPANEINELTYVIKTDLATLHKELEVLHDWVVSHRDGTYTNESEGLLTAQSTKNSTAIVDQLRNSLMDTTKNFQEVLQVRTNNLKEQNQRRKQFEAGSSSSSSASSGSSSGGVATSSSTSALTATGNAAVRKRGANPFDALLNAPPASHGVETEATSKDDLVVFNPDVSLQDQLLATPVQADDYLASRAEAVESIEGIIVELGEMYARLVHIVGMQDEVIIRIDQQMDQALEHTDKGLDQLTKYYESISGNRWLILKIFGVLLTFLIFFMIFVA